MNNTSEHLQVNRQPSTKKQWVTPKAEVVSNDAVQGGTKAGGQEGHLTIHASYAYSGS